MLTTKKPKTFYAVGLGVNFRAHITPEAKEALSTCPFIFALTPDSTAISYLEREFPQSQILDCAAFYEGRNTRPEAYEAIGDEVIKTLDLGSDVALVTYGHPMFLVSAVENTIDRAKAAGHHSFAVPGVTSLDTLQADLQVDIGYGATIADATLLLEDEIPFSTKIPLVVFQVANLRNRLIEDADIPAERIWPFVDYLLKIYPPEHSCALVVSRKSLFDPGEVAWMQIYELKEQNRIALNMRPTLYIPEVRK